MRKIMKGKKGMEWVSTVLYVLISIAIIGVLLMAIRPKVSEMKDRIILSQTVEGMNVFDETMQLAKTSVGTNLRYTLQLNKGNFIIDSQKDQIRWEGDSNYMYSEPGKTVSVSRISALTTKKSGLYSVSLTLDYSAYGINLTYGGMDTVPKTLNPSSIPYTLWIMNNGKTGSKLAMDVYLG